MLEDFEPLSKYVLVSAESEKLVKEAQQGVLKSIILFDHSLQNHDHPYRAHENEVIEVEGQYSTAMVQSILCYGVR